MTDLLRVTLLDGLMDSWKWECPIWVDHVLFDIPETLSGVVRAAPDNVKMITVHETVVTLKHRYSKFFALCEKRGIDIMVARVGTYERVPLEEL